MPDLTPDSDELLADFTEWVTRSRPGEQVRSFVDAYHEHLGESLGAEAADAAIRRLFQLMADRPEPWRPLFDRIYSTPGDGFNLEPNAFLVEAVSGVEPGSAIDVAMGQGRNAVYLAALGWKVTGIDISPVGVDQARSAAASRGLEIEATAIGHDDYDFGEDRWDLMVFTYTPVKLAESATVDRVRRALKPRGRLVAESFRKPLEGPARPVDLDPDELVDAYTGFDIERLEAVKLVPDWDSTPQQVVRLIAISRP